jgi:hypothetical protein
MSVTSLFQAFPSTDIILYYFRDNAGILSCSIQAYPILFMSNKLCYAFVPAPFPECRYVYIALYLHVAVNLQPLFG